MGLPPLDRPTCTFSASLPHKAFPIIDEFSLLRLHLILLFTALGSLLLLSITSGSRQHSPKGILSEIVDDFICKGCPNL